MATNFEKLNSDFKKLSAIGDLLYYTMYSKLYPDDKRFLENFEKAGVKFYSDFNQQYEKWYTESLPLLKVLAPDRHNDFVRYYNLEKRKTIEYDTYTLRDYLDGLQITKSAFGETKILVDGKAALPKMQAQKNIINSLEQRFTSSLFQIQKMVQADLFDNELSAADALNKAGFPRAAGALAGVVLERHLRDVCNSHSLSSSGKKHLMINDYNEMLKSAQIIDLTQWRFIQFLADIRNGCDHPKTSEPTKENVADLITGVNKCLKTII